MKNEKEANDEKFYLHIDFEADDLEIDLHASQEHIAMGIIALSEHLAPEIIGGVIGGLEEGMLKSKSGEINESVN